MKCAAASRRVGVGAQQQRQKTRPTTRRIARRTQRRKRRRGRMVRGHVAADVKTRAVGLRPAAPALMRPYRKAISWLARPNAQRVQCTISRLYEKKNLGQDHQPR